MIGAPKDDPRYVSPETAIAAAEGQAVKLLAVTLWKLGARHVHITTADIERADGQCAIVVRYDHDGVHLACVSSAEAAETNRSGVWPV